MPTDLPRPTHRPSGNFPAVAKPLGDVLVRRNIVSPAQLKSAMESAERTNRHLSLVLAELGFLDGNALRELLAEQYKVPSIDLGTVSQPEEDVLKAVSREICERNVLVPISLIRSPQGSRLILAMVDPGNFSAIDDLRFSTGFSIERVVATSDDVLQAIKRFYQPFEEAERGFGLAGELEGLADSAEISSHDVDVIDVATLEKSSEDAPIVRYVNLMLVDAFRRGASDIHIETYENEFRIRYRIDGILYEMQRPHVKVRNAIISRIKIMCSLDISEHRLPQDGQMKMRLSDGTECDFRVSVTPFLFGEKIVMRLLDKSSLQKDMTKLGLDPEDLEKLLHAIEQPHGMVLVTGPTGSGKTTTLYSALYRLSKPEVNICTAEDPVEFKLRGINQLAVHESIGLNFAAALRSFLRQDPDIIMVGEIRDFETAEIAIKASLTGHMVLSTLHTNDAPSTVSRLMNMGVEHFLITASLNLIAAQRLVRRICLSCQKEHVYDRKACIDAGLSPDEYTVSTFKKGAGCTLCNGTGFKGRVAIYEIMPMTDNLRDAILQGSSVSELKRVAIADGMQTLRRSGLMKLANGLTTLEEILRVTRPD